VDEATPLCLLLLDGVLEDVVFGRRAEDLNRAPGVVVVEPGRRPPPSLLAPRVAKRLAKRLPGVPRVILLVGDTQRSLALALHGEHEGSELWEVAPEDDPSQGAFQVNAELWARLEERGIAQR
jgi:hypothetical protein